MLDDDEQPDLFGKPSYTLYDGRPPAQKHSDTSRAAANRIKGRIGPLHREIITYLTNSVQGATDEEMQANISMPANTQRPRRVELTQMGIVMDSGYRKLTHSRREAVVWAIQTKRSP